MARKISDIFSPKKELEPQEIKESWQKRKFSPKKLWFLIFSLIILFFAFTWLYPKVTLKIVPEIKEKFVEAEIFLNKEREGVDFEKMEIPMKILERKEIFSDEFLASGEILKEQKAHGKVRIFNNSQKDQILIAGTRLQPPQEKFKIPLQTNENPWFRIKERVIVPAKGFVDVEVEADSPGEKYNISPSFFSIPGLAGTPQYSLVYAQSFQPMEGGMRKKVPQVKKEDLLDAENILKERAEKTFSENLKKEFADIFEVLTDSSLYEIIDKKSSAKEGDEAEKFVFQITLQGKAILFSKEDLKSIIKKLILKETENEEEVLEKTLDFQIVEKSFNLNEGKGKIKVKGSAKFYWKLPEELLKKSLAGKDLKENILLLQNQPEIKNIKINYFPFWLSKFPSDPKRITIIFEIPVD